MLLIFENNYINLIGPGKVGSSIFNHLLNKGFEKGTIIDSSFRISEYKNLSLKGLIFLGVPDDKISYIVQNLKKTDLKNVEAIFHFSGYHTTELFEGLNIKHKITIHPNKSFESKNVILDNVTWGVECEKESFFIVEKLIKLLNGKILLVPKEKKKEYHLAAVISSNFVYGLIKMSNDIYEEIGLGEKDHLIELLINAASNVKNKDLFNSLTGPVQRGDLKVIEEEKNIFAKYFDKNVYDFFIEKLEEIKKGGGA